MEGWKPRMRLLSHIHVLLLLARFGVGYHLGESATSFGLSISRMFRIYSEPEPKGSLTRRYICWAFGTRFQYLF